jgi:hypothetical protein
MLISIDFETYYDSKYSLRKMSTWDYVFDEKFDAYLVAAYGDNNTKWVGHPKDFDWSIIHGQDIPIHNASFDEVVMMRLQEDGIIPKEVKPDNVFCTADLTAYLRCKRSLKDASKYLLKEEISKATRDYMQGRTWAQIIAEGKEQEVLDYGTDDARLSYQLFKDFGHLWPQVERDYSRLNREACYRGIPIAVGEAEEAVKDLKTTLWETGNKMPWIDDGKKPMSMIAIQAQGKKDGIPVPASRSKQNEDAIAWFKKYGTDYPWVQAIQDYTSINGQLKRTETLATGARKDGTFPLQIKYFGAHTGRTSAGSMSVTGGKFNPLNFPRKPMFDVDLRGLVRAPEGFIFGILDYSQIEAIMLAWRVGDQELLDLTIKEGNLYQAYAKKMGWYPMEGKSLKGDDPVLYGRTKVTVLQLGYQSGWAKFQHIAEVNYGIIFDDAEAEGIVTGYRKDNPKIVDYWAEHHKIAQFSCNHGDDTHEVELVSGRNMTYYDPQWRSGGRYGREMIMRDTMGDRFKKTYGGILTENEIQATARDVLRDARVACDEAGHNTLWDVYDEIIFLFPEDEAEQRLADASKIMISSSPWAEGCPLGVEGSLTDRYEK